MKIIIENDQDYEQGLLLLDAVMSVAKDEDGEPLLPIIDVVAGAVTAYEDQLPSVQLFERSIEEQFGTNPADLNESELLDLISGRVKEAIADTKATRKRLNEMLSAEDEQIQEALADVLIETINSLKTRIEELETALGNAHAQIKKTS